MATGNAFGYPMNLRAYATRGIIWAQRKVFKEWLKGRVSGHGMMPLGAFIKRDLGKQAVHLGGVTQILFGIKGGRWEKFPMINQFYNDFWVRPGESERPANFRQHEGGAYW